jgi:hypothetical protein
MTVGFTKGEEPHKGLMENRTYNPIWYETEQRKDHCLAIAEEGEVLFRSLTGAIKGTFEEDLQHIDCYWKGEPTDVKGLKPMHSQGYILVEFINNWGTHGWCSKKSKAKYIAFQFPNEFIIVSKMALRSMAITLCPQYNETIIFRKNYIKPYEGLHKWCGRAGKKDMFTYLLAEELYGIADEKIKFAQ